MYHCKQKQLCFAECFVIQVSLFHFEISFTKAARQYTENIKMTISQVAYNYELIFT